MTHSGPAPEHCRQSKTKVGPVQAKQHANSCPDRKIGGARACDAQPGGQVLQYQCFRSESADDRQADCAQYLRNDLYVQDSGYAGPQAASRRHESPYLTNDK